MKVSLYYCPLCEKNRVDHVSPTVWICKECDVVFELTDLNYNKSMEQKEAMSLTLEFTIVKRKEVDDMQKMRERV